jgi:hypothetical protein
MLEERSTEDRRVARGCLSCDETGCFRHRPALRSSAARGAALVSERVPEFATWLDTQAADADWFLPWVRAARRAQSWALPADRPAWTARAVGYRRLLRGVLARGEGAARQAARQHDAAALAAAYARRLRPEHVELSLSQDLLVPLWRSGALGGRAYDVWVGELPAGELQARLDAAAGQRPRAASLTDFRVDADWVADEWAALAGARRRLTCHADIARVLAANGLRVERQPWRRGPATPRAPRAANATPTLVLAGSALARKGALEVAELARRLRARVLILGSAPADPSLWQDVDWSRIGYAGAWLEQADLVLLPAHIEHQPRALLRALDQGLPVIATLACGIAPCPGLTLVPAGDVDALEQQARTILPERHP